MGQAKTIFLVDDDEAVRDSTRALLEAHGYEVQDFASASALLDSTRGEGADCLVLDLHMPGLSGIELLELLRKRGIPVPAIILTGRYDPSIEPRIAKAGVLTLLAKPADSGALLEWIRQAVNTL